MALQFQRNADVYVEVMDTARTEVLTAWKIPVLEGFSFTQSINSSEITINEAGTTSRRARLLFNDSLAPAEWSFSTYVRPVVATNVLAPEQVLWAMMFGASAFGVDATVSPPVGAANVYRGIGNTAVNTLNAGTENTFNLSASNISAMPDNWNIVFAFEDGTNKQYFRLNKAVVNSASIDFDIEGIATISWSGFSVDIQDLGATEPTNTASPAVALSDYAITTGTSGTDNFIRNRISTVTLNRTDNSPSDSYSIVLTGGSFSIENNISYLTPSELGNVNVPLANITGARSISGSLTCYFDSGSGNDDKSGELFRDLVADTTTIRNVFDMAVNIGGVSSGTPRLALDLPTAHLEIPTINVEDLLTLEVNFHGQVASGNVDSTNEATIIYKA